MKRVLMSAALAFVLSATVLAGDMPGVGQSPAPGEIPSVGVTAPGDIPTVNSTAPGDVPTVGMSIVVVLLDLAF